MNLLPMLLLSIMAQAADPPPDAPVERGTISVQIKAAKPVKLTPADLAKLKRVTVEAGKEDQRHSYEGVALAEVLHAAGITWGTKCSLWIDCYVVVEGADEYRAVFSIPEVDPGLAHKQVVIADTCDGTPLARSIGPYQSVEEDAKQHGRCVRQVVKVHVRMAAD